MSDRGETRETRDDVPEGEIPGPKSARSCLVVLLMFHGLILSQVAIVLTRLVPDWAATYADSSKSLSANSRILIALSGWVMDNPILALLFVLGVLLGSSGLFLGTWRIKPKSAVTWWMRGTFVVGIALIAWLYLSLYLTTLHVDSVAR